jgi:ABC-type Mn2+/Zn2+ transport system ATPase subunit
LIVTDKDEVIFSSRGKWLHPLFELGDFLELNSYSVADLFLTDKIAGKAAAFLIAKLGITKVHIHLISQGAITVFQRFGIAFSFDEKVAVIQCRTEQIVSTEMDIETVWQMLRRRAGRVSGIEIEIEKIDVDISNRSVLSEISLSLKKGDHIAINGPNGAGKSTLMKAILGIQPIKTGKIVVDGTIVGSNEWNRKRNMVGYVNQEQIKGNFPISAYEVAEIGLSAQHFSKTETIHRVEIAMRRTGCFHLANRSFHELSGGEQQRVSIARCLCQQARLILFDEPTAFLDATGKMDLKELITELWKNEAPTMIIVSHDENWINQLDWPVFELKEGKLCSMC